MSAENVLAEFLRDRPATVRVFPAEDAVFGELRRPLASKVAEVLAAAGTGRFYSHQAEAIDAALAGKDVMVTTSTSSGKSLCFNAPVLNHCMTEPVARAMYLFPTKALAQDQAGKLEALGAPLGIRCSTYDGDTPKSVRSMVRRESHVILTNPDMLHMGILPQHELWTKFFRSLRTIVVDEAHTYRGVFGGHVGWVLRRLLRLCAWHGSHPQVIACSATVADPGRLFEDLTGRSAVLVSRDGAPKGEKAVFVVEPVLAEDAADGKGSSPNTDSARLLADMAAQGVKTMAFCRARTSVELVVRTARKFLEGKGLDPGLVDSYRGGYTPEERRDIEQRLFRGELLGLATTNAMELGVDVGGLDAVVLNGYPGRLSSFWQQSGRAGRAGRAGLAVMLAHADPLERFLAQNPELLTEGKVEPSIPSVRNPYIVSAQLRCAAYERPVGFDELEQWGPASQETAASTVDADDLREAQGRLFYPSHEAPAAKVNIRGSDGDGVRLILNGETLGEMEYWRALRSAHQGAVYLHRGESYLVTSLELDRRLAFLEQAKTDYFTMPIEQAVVEPGVVLEEKRFGPFRVQHLGLEVTSAVTGFRRMRLDGQSVLDETPLNLPPQTFATLGLRVDCEGPMFTIEDPGTMALVHTLEHVWTALAPMRAGCDRRDLGSAWYFLAPDTMQPCVYLYDDTPGGLGFCASLYEQFEGLVADSRELVGSCSCEDGCPLCIMSSLCESANEPLTNTGVLKLLNRVLD